MTFQAHAEDINGKQYVLKTWSSRENAMQELRSQVRSGQPFIVTDGPGGGPAGGEGLLNPRHVVYIWFTQIL